MFFSCRSDLLLHHASADRMEQLSSPLLSPKVQQEKLVEKWKNWDMSHHYDGACWPPAESLTCCATIWIFTIFAFHITLSQIWFQIELYHLCIKIPLALRCLKCPLCIVLPTMQLPRTRLICIMDGPHAWAFLYVACSAWDKWSMLLFLLCFHTFLFGKSIWRNKIHWCIWNVLFFLSLPSFLKTYRFIEKMKNFRDKKVKEREKREIVSILSFTPQMATLAMAVPDWSQ